jgi:hypothetical protein
MTSSLVEGFILPGILVGSFVVSVPVAFLWSMLFPDKKEGYTPQLYRHRYNGF